MYRRLRAGPIASTSTCTSGGKRSRGIVQSEADVGNAQLGELATSAYPILDAGRIAQPLFGRGLTGVQVDNPDRAFQQLSQPGRGALEEQQRERLFADLLPVVVEPVRAGGEGGFVKTTARKVSTHV